MHVRLSSHDARFASSARLSLTAPGRKIKATADAAPMEYGMLVGKKFAWLRRCAPLCVAWGVYLGAQLLDTARESGVGEL